jgi:ElaB/YqjD/DUF883 family membrane-anchored ribosome-binding protein
MEQSNTSNTDSPQGIIGKVRERATAQLTEHKDTATAGLGSVAQAVRQSTQHLRDEQHDTIAQYVEQAADQLDRFSKTLKERSVGDLMNDAQKFARSQPAIFIGAAFAAGLLGARFLKSSNGRNQALQPYNAGQRFGTPGRAGYAAGEL